MAGELSPCTRCESPLERGDLRCAICGQAVPQHGGTRDTLAVEVLRCAGCGAAVAYDAATQAPRCAFCDAVMHVESIEDPMEQTEAFLPFKVSSEEASRSLRAWLGGLGWFRPPDLVRSSRLENARPLFWVGWVFDANALVSWTADSDAGSRRSAWAPHSGQVEMLFDNILVSASRGLSDDETDFLTSSYSLEEELAAPEDSEELVVEQFDVQRSLARRRILDAIDQVAATRVAREHVPGSRTRKVQAVALLRGLETRRLAFPAFVLAYRYRDRLYRAVVSGQDSAQVMGKAPWSVPRILAAAALGLGLVFAVVLVIAASS